jgi:hypothetical protein
MRRNTRNSSSRCRKEEIRPASTPRPGIHPRDLGHGQHEHDHPRHGGPDRAARYVHEPEIPQGQPPSDLRPRRGKDWWKEAHYQADEFYRFPKGAGYPGGKADWGWVQLILASIKPQGRAAVVLDTGAASHGSGNANTNKEKDVRRWFVEHLRWLMPVPGTPIVRVTPSC